MDKSEINKWLAGFVSDLTVGGERIPLDRVIEARLAGLQSLRDLGLTWQAIATMIARAGGSRSDGTPISAAQLRGDVARLTRRGMAARPPPPASSPAPPRATRPISKAAKPKRERASSPYPSSHQQPSDKDVSAQEIAAALNRINKPH